MSLLLDALKEAEARKREAAPAVAAPATVAAAAASTLQPSLSMAPDFDTVGALALAEDVPTEPAANPAAAPTPLRPAATTAPTASPTPTLPATPAATLLAARTARATVAAAKAELPASVRQPASGAPPAPGQARGRLPWLLALAALLALLFGGAIAYDTFMNPVSPAAIAPAAAPPDEAASPSPAAPEPAFLPPDSKPPAPRDADTGLELRNGPSASPGGATTPGRAGPRTSAGRDPGPPRTTTAPAPAASGETRPRPIEAGLRDARIAISREPAPLDAAWAAQQSGDLDRAAALYRRVLENEQGQVDAQLGLAVIAHARGDDEAARRGYRLVLESSPEQPRAWAGLAELAGEDDSGGIESRLRQLLASRPSAPLQFALGNLLARQARWSDAQQAYFAAATLAPEAPDYGYNVAVALERLGKPAAAVPWYARALQQAAAGRAVRFDVTEARARLEQLQAAAP